MLGARSTTASDRDEALAMVAPGPSAFQPSAVPFPERLPEIEYPDGDEVVTVERWNGIFKF